ncbi:pirin family protein [Siphonobacter sp. SORGH_AS_0500]|uniref:pirin family protein n=1 Tax=Siphonobacter sp. SORGH_AS_0500 TaxID=1864824 RepID=UPI00285ACE55|nr:pirin family protein [Siphonobacter sp. SORGH_AS_0500]MDR6196648.1 redox-sensitive bicupin YhaK (pirin superfamily) [Siphonobacter sp. SORGH_AS_0500]
MTLRSIHKIIHPQPRPMGPLTMHQPLPAAGLDQIDPFLLLHHHGPQVFPAHNNGLPFSPHPHRGFETVTFIYEGDVQHRDSSGFASTIKKGGVQWMTTGSGLVHAEESSEEFLESGGPVELIQLWTNLPARYKMVKPNYTGLQEQDIPLASVDKGSVAVISGEWNGIKGPIQPLIDLSLANVSLQTGGSFTRTIPAQQNILFYLLNGSIIVNGREVNNRSLVQFANDGNEITVEATSDSRILIGSAEPLNEPVVAHGPFVMNTYEEIQQAITDYQLGKMGVL